MSIRFLPNFTKPYVEQYMAETKIRVSSNYFMKNY